MEDMRSLLGFFFGGIVLGCRRLFAERFAEFAVEKGQEDVEYERNGCSTRGQEVREVRIQEDFS